MPNVVRFQNKYGIIHSVPTTEVFLIKILQENPDLTALDTIVEVEPAPTPPEILRVNKAQEEIKPNVVAVPLKENVVYPPYDDLWARVIKDKPLDSEEVFLLAQDIPEFQKITRDECADMWLYIHHRERWVKSNGRNNA